MEQGGKISEPRASPGVPAGVPVTKASEKIVVGQEKGTKPGAPKRAVVTGRGRRVDRKTELHNAAASFTDPHGIRKRTERDLLGPDPEIPYYSAEEAVRDLVCTIMEREDRLYDDLYIRWNGMKHRIEALEDEIAALKSGRTEVRK